MTLVFTNGNQIVFNGGPSRKSPLIIFELTKKYLVNNWNAVALICSSYKLDNGVRCSMYNYDGASANTAQGPTFVSPEPFPGTVGDTDTLGDSTCSFIGSIKHFQFFTEGTALFQSKNSHFSSHLILEKIFYTLIYRQAILITSTPYVWRLQVSRPSSMQSLRPAQLQRFLIVSQTYV